jgi:hypothetical protein
MVRRAEGAFVDDVGEVRDEGVELGGFNGLSFAERRKEIRRDAGEKAFAGAGRTG